MDIFGAIGNLLGGLFGGGQKKKQQPTAPVVQPPVSAPQPTRTVQQPSSFLQHVNDFTAQANDALYGGLIKGGVNIANSIGTGFNQDETAKRTNDFLHTIGQNNTPDNQSMLAAGTNKNSTAGQLGQAVGQTEKTVAQTVPLILAPGAAATSLPGRIAVGAGTGLGAGFAQGAANGGSLTDDLTSAGIGGIAGGAISGGAPVVGNVAKRVFNSLTGGVEAGGANAAASIVRDPSSPITTSPTTIKPPAITSANRPAPVAPTVQPPRPLVSAPEAIAPPPVVRAPAPVPAENPIAIAPTPFDAPEAAPVVAPPKPLPVPAEKTVPQYTSPIRTNKTASVSGPNSAKYATGDDNLDNIVHDSIVAHKGSAKTAADRADALDNAGITADQRAQIRNIAVKEADKTTGKISAQGVQQIKDVASGKVGTLATKAKNEVLGVEEKAQHQANTAAGAAPVDAPTTSQLGTITRDAVRDGSIKTAEGVDKVVADTTAAAHRDAAAAGDKLENIVKKGQQAYEDSKTAGHDLTPNEVLEKQPSFTHAQQEVYKNYAQELSTLRDRSGHSLKGGNQGQWYAPRQFLDDEGASQAYDPALVNELKRTGAKTDSSGNALDYSAAPFEHYIRRYSDAGNAATERMVNAVEHDEQGVESGIKIPGEAKDNLNKSMADIADKRDQIDQLKAAGDEEGAKALHAVVQKDTRQAFTKFINDIPKGAGRQEAINRVKSMRDTYETSLSQTLTTSNLVNRVADQGTKAVEALKRPLVQGLKKVVGGKYKTIAKAGGTDAFDLNTSRAATKAASQFSRGTLGREVIDNAKAVISQAGAGRNPLVKGIAKVDATVRAAGGSLLEAGDLSTPNVREALQIGASRPEAQGLKTVADYKKYFNDYTKTSKFKDDLATVQEMQNPKVGLAGGEVQKSGKISNFLSREVDNVLSTNADRIKPGLGKNRIVREANDFVKGNVTGYAGVTSRVLGTVRDAAVPIVPLRRAAAQAASGDPAAVARATTTAAHAVADSIALYGTAGAAATLGATKVIGYTGAQPVQGSSASAYNKDHNIPANQWFLNLPGGKRLYFDPARPAGGPGVAADIAGSVLSGSNPLIAGENIATQISNQAGGSSIPQDIVNVQNAMSPSASAADKKYAMQQLQATAAPATGILNNIANFIDPTKRAPKNFVDDLKSNIPVLRSQTPAAKTAAGDPIANSKQVSGGSGLFSVADNADSAAPGSKAGADPVASEVARLHNAGIDVTPTTANTNASQANVKSLSSALLKDPIYASADDKTKAAYLKTVLDGTATKKIDPSLSSGDKQALLDGTLLGAKKGAWLDDNTNNASYTQATYDNAKASGTLTAAQDDITKSGSLKYKAVAARVDENYGTDQQLRDDYSGVSQSEFTALLNPKSPSYDLAKAQKVYNYDKARSSAGLPAKYDLDKAQKTGAYASTGSGASKNFSFASLPSSLVGTGSASSNGGYASDAPLFKPIASLQAPVGAAIPSGRTISVKKGVAL